MLQRTPDNRPDGHCAALRPTELQVTLSLGVHFAEVMHSFSAPDYFSWLLTLSSPRQVFLKDPGIIPLNVIIREGRALFLSLCGKGILGQRAPLANTDGVLTRGRVQTQERADPGASSLPLTTTALPSLPL